LSLYDPEKTSQYYDQYGDQEWERLIKNSTNQINFHVHQWYLHKYIQPHHHVLEAGAGPGRFTIELAKLGAMITVGDISPKQLELNKQKVKESGYENHVIDRRILNIVNLSEYPANHFDAVVCYGGPLSYTFDHFHEAMSELIRVTKPSGYVLISVMSCIGTVRAFFPAILQHYRPELIAVG
jgi:ubiquinone/menaquinone biosynthesis C-methylase UbiE